MCSPPRHRPCQGHAADNQSTGPQWEAGITHGLEQPQKPKGGGAWCQMGGWCQTGRMEEEGRKGSGSHLSGSRETEGRSPISLSEQFPLCREAMTWLHCPKVSFHLPPGGSQVLQGREGLTSSWVLWRGKAWAGPWLGSDFLCDSPAPSKHRLTHLLKEILGLEELWGLVCRAGVGKTWAGSRPLLCSRLHRCDLLHSYRNTRCWHYRRWRKSSARSMTVSKISPIVKTVLGSEPRAVQDLNNLSSSSVELGYCHSGDTYLPLDHNIAPA